MNYSVPQMVYVPSVDSASSPAKRLPRSRINNIERYVSCGDIGANKLKTGTLYIAVNGELNGIVYEKLVVNSGI